MMRSRLDELKDAAKAEELLRIAKKLAEEAEGEQDPAAKSKLESQARDYLQQARQLRSPPRRKKSFFKS